MFLSQIDFDELSLPV